MDINLVLPTLQGDRTASDTAIGHNSFIEDSSFEPFNVEFASSSQVSVAEIDIFERRFRQFSPSQIDIAQVGISEIGLKENSINQNSASQVSPSQNRFFKPYPFHVSPTKIGEHKISSVHNSEAKIGILENNISQIGIDQFDLGQIDSSEISFARSISSEQFFSSHNSSPQIINVLNNSATNIWSDLLQSETQLDINFQITDLPTGQLAEATITGFDSSGVPNAGTILIDHDANGIGWFVDETPLESSEFEIQNSETYLLATTESEANGKYDLLTTGLADHTVNEGSAIAFTGSYSDTGINDSHTVTWDLGDGNMDSTKATP